MKSTTVAVVIPAYNAVKTLQRCVLSVIADSWENKEIIIVNDGSTDDTLSLALELQQRFPECIHVLNQDNAGANTARNAGMRHTQAAYVQFLDSDDCVQNDKLAQSMRLLLSQPHLVCVYACLEVFMDGVSKGIQAFEDADVKALAARNSKLFTCGLQTSMPVWSRNYLVEEALYWDESLPCWQESEYYPRILMHLGDCARIAALDIAGIAFHRDGTSEGISGNYWSEKYILGQFRAVSLLVDQCRKYGMPSVKDQEMNFYRLLWLRAVVGGHPAAYDQIQQSLRGSDSLADVVRRMMPYSVVRLVYRVNKYIKIKRY